MNNNIPYLRNKISTLLVLSAAILILLSSPQLFKPLPIQASQPAPTSFRTPTRANGYDDCAGGDASLTFDAHGNPSSSNPNQVQITNGNTW